MSKISPSVPIVGQVVPFNAGDVERALAYWAENATVTLVGIPAGEKDAYCGKEQVRGWLKDLVGRHMQIEIKVIRMRDDTVTVQIQLWSKALRDPGEVPITAKAVYLVTGGRITALTLTLSLKSRLMLQPDVQVQAEGGEIKTGNNLSDPELFPGINRSDGSIKKEV